MPDAESPYPVATGREPAPITLIEKVLSGYVLAHLIDGYAIEGDTFTVYMDVRAYIYSIKEIEAFLDGVSLAVHYFDRIKE